MMRKVKANALVVMFALAAGLSVAGEKKYVYCGWDVDSATMDELAESADLFAGAPIDGVGLCANFKDERGRRRNWSEPFSRERYSDEALGRFVPVLRSFAEKSGLRENFLETTESPTNRLDWTDDAGWKLCADNFAVLARFAKASGLRGLIVDFEDYNKTRQFARLDGDPDYRTCVQLARRRGAELFRPAFADFPDMKILAYYFFTLESRYVEEQDKVALMQETGDLYPAFLNGILDVLPDTATVVEGNEIAYQLEARNGGFWRYADSQRRGILPLVAAANRGKYLSQVGVSFGQYADSYWFDESKTFYMAPLDGSRLKFFRANLSQATRAADEYVWLWNEHCPFVRWRRNVRAAALLKNGTLDERIPGLSDMLLSVKDPMRFWERRGGGLTNLVLALEMDVWQSKTSEKDGGTIRTEDFAGPNGLSFADVSDGCVSWSLGKVAEGDAFLLRADWRGEGLPFGRCSWSRAGRWYVADPVLLSWERPQQDGWRRGAALAVVPAGADRAKFELLVKQTGKGVSTYRNVFAARIE